MSITAPRARKSSLRQMIRGVIGGSHYQSSTIRIEADALASLESRVLTALEPSGRLLLPATLCAVLGRPLGEIELALESLRAQRLAARNRCGQWYAVYRMPGVQA